LQLINFFFIIVYKEKMQRIERNNKENFSEKKLVEPKLIEHMNNPKGVTGTCSNVSSMTSSLPSGCTCVSGAWKESEVMGFPMYGCM
jgi:hypothetical protein